MPLGGPWSEPLLAVDRVRFVGEPVAIVLTDNHLPGRGRRRAGQRRLRAAARGDDVRRRPGRDSLLFPDAGTNVSQRPRRRLRRRRSSTAATSSSRATSSTSGSPACRWRAAPSAAAWKDGKLTVWASTQNAQIARLILTAIGLPPDAIRVVAPDVGGGFGAKIGVDRESILVAWAAKHTGRPVRWVESRSENLIAMTQGRAQRHHIKIGGTADGHIKAYRLDVVQDTGAYARMSGFLPMLTVLMAPGVYDIPAVQAGYKVVVTNATPIAAYRGAGRPEAAATIERAVDWFAAEAGLDPAAGAQGQLHQEGAVPVRHQDGRALRHR